MVGATHRLHMVYGGLHPPYKRVISARARYRRRGQDREPRVGTVDSDFTLLIIKPEYHLDRFVLAAGVL
jgi:hypothetical protein